VVTLAALRARYQSAFGAVPEAAAHDAHVLESETTVVTKEKTKKHPK